MGINPQQRPQTANAPNPVNNVPPIQQMAGNKPALQPPTMGPGPQAAGAMGSVPAGAGTMTQGGGTPSGGGVPMQSSTGMNMMSPQIQQILAMLGRGQFS